MTRAPRQLIRAVRFLREDPDLADALAPAERADAVEQCVARVMSLPKGRWSDSELGGDPGGIGLLVLDGLLIRRVGVDGRYGAELIGDGDLIRPWSPAEVVTALPFTTGWRALERSRFAVLDEVAAQRLCAWPPLVGALTSRALRRSRHLAINMAIVHHPRTEVRLQMLMWHLAGRWGRVRPDGVLVPLKVSHTVLADLVAAQRPSVSGSLGRLGERGLIVSTADGWLLRGDPPSELLDVDPVTLPADGRGE